MFITIGHAHHEPSHVYERPANLPYWTLGLIVRGRSVFEAEGSRLTTHGPELSLTAPHAPYRTSYGGGGRWESYWAVFTPRRDWQTWLRLPPRGPLSEAFGALQLRDAAARRAVVAAFRDGCAAIRSVLPQRDALALNAVERILILADTVNPLAAHARLDPRVREAMDLMASHYDRRLAVADVAHHVHLSPSHLAHLFSEQVGCAPMAYLQQQRLGRARELLITTSDPINQIARAVGFDNAFHFSTRFRQHVGVGPRAYRTKPV